MVEFAKTSRFDAILHCGDYVAPFTAKIFFESGIPFYGVIGNCDGEISGLRRVTEGMIDHIMLSIRLGERDIIIQHRPFHEEQLLHKENTLFLYGHTHRSAITRKGNNLVVNPGELCGVVSGTKSFATIDLDTLDTEIEIL